MTYTIRTQAPEQGHFWSFGPLPLSAPPVLKGANGVRAYRLFELGQHSAIYGFESFAELLPEEIQHQGFRELHLVAAEKGDPIPDMWVHPSVRDDISEIIPDVMLGDQQAGPPTITAESSSIAHSRFQLDYASDDYTMRLWVTIMARSPVLHCEGVVARKDRLPDDDLAVKFSVRETLIGEDTHWCRIGRGGVDIIRFRIACQSDRSSSVSAEPPVSDDLTAIAIAAESGQTNGFAFLPLEWGGQWLGVEPVTSPRGQQFRWDASWKTFPFASELGANQGGSQASLGATFSIPLWSDPDPDFVHDLWRNAQDWAFRPVHIFEPGTLDPVDPRHKAELQTVKRQPYGVSLWHGQHVPPMGTKGLDGRTSHDEQHMADMPLFAAYACTGSPALRWLMESHSALDLMQKRPQVGWRNNGRGEGRTGYNMLAAGTLLGGKRQADIQAHIERRLAIAWDLSSTKNAPEEEACRVLHLLSDPRLNCTQPCWQVYEEAQFAWSSWVLYEQTGSAAALKQAYRSGLAVATTLWQEGGQWSVPYSVFGREDGKPLDRDDLDPSAPTVHAGGQAWLWWSGCGLNALMRAVSAKPELVLDGHRPHVDRAREALEWLASLEAPNWVEPHMALHAIPVPPEPTR